MPDSYIVLPIEDAELIDDDTTQDEGGSGNPIAIVDGYGCGYSSTNDCVVYRDIDFGGSGAKQISLLFGYGNDDGSATTLSVALDDEDKEPNCVFFLYINRPVLRNRTVCFVFRPKTIR